MTGKKFVYSNLSSAILIISDIALTGTGDVFDPVTEVIIPIVAGFLIFLAELASGEGFFRSLVMGAVGGVLVAIPAPIAGPLAGYLSIKANQ